MKYLIIPFLIFLCSCGKRVPHTAYSYKDKINVNRGFYKGCVVIINKDYGMDYQYLTADIVCEKNEITYKEYNLQINKEDLK